MTSMSAVITLTDAELYPSVCLELYVKSNPFLYKLVLPYFITAVIKGTANDLNLSCTIHMAEGGNQLL